MEIFKKVPIPKTGIVIVRSNPNKIPYVYHYVETFRNDKGKPDNKRVSIGKLSEVDNMLIPNKTYFELFDKEITKEDCIELSNTLRFGNFVLFDKITQDLELDKILQYAFGNIYQQILIMAFYVTDYSSKMLYIDDWCEENYVFDNMIIEPKRTSDYFKEITKTGKDIFFKNWIEQNSIDEYVAYDVTSRSSYSENNELNEYGYNRDGENLAQTNIGIFFGEKSKMPIYYNEYSGSITDVTHLPFMMQGVKELELEVSKFVLDTGFYSQSNILDMCENKLKFIVCMRKVKLLLELVYKKINKIKSSEYYILEHGIYGNSYNQKFGKYNCKIHIFYDSAKLAAKENEFYTKIEGYRKELELLEKMNKNNFKKYSKYFDINVNENDETFTFLENHKKVNEEFKLLGYFACISNDLTLTSSEVVEIYRKKDVVEKHHDNMKNFSDFDRLGTHSTKTAVGKELIGFISLIYKSYIEKITSEYAKKNKMTTEKMLLELGKIKVQKVNGVKRLVQPISAKQEKILQLFQIKKDDVSKMAKEIIF